MNFFYFFDWFQKKWILFKIQLAIGKTRTGLQMKTAEGHQRGCSGDFIVKLKKKYKFLAL